MTKKAKILVSLLNKSAEESNDEIAKEIFEYLRETPQLIPWVEQVLQVKVQED
jgi:hypothetical protein